MTAQDLPSGLVDLLVKHNQGVLATIRGNGRPQLSVVTYGFDAERAVAHISITDGRAKTANLRRDPRASLEVTNSRGFGYVVAEGTAELSPPAVAPDDATVEGLVEYYRAASGEHPDWDDYRAAMVSERRILLTLHVERLYGIEQPD